MLEIIQPSAKMIFIIHREIKLLIFLALSNVSQQQNTFDNNILKRQNSFKLGIIKKSIFLKIPLICI